MGGEGGRDVGGAVLGKKIGVNMMAFSLLTCGFHYAVALATNRMEKKRLIMKYN